VLAERWPRAVAFSDLLVEARQRANQPMPTPGLPPDELILAGNLLRSFSYSTQLVSLHRYEPKLVTAISEYPIATPAARLEAMSRSVVTNAWHERVTISPLQAQVLVRLDGTVSQATLQAQLAQIAPALGLAWDDELTSRTLQQLVDTALLVG
jgi:hypothetical protein